MNFNFINKAGEKKLGTDEEEFVRILCSRSYVQLRATFEEYYKISGIDIEKSIKKETSGDLEDALLAIGNLFELYISIGFLNNGFLVKSIRNRVGFFAERLRESMKGIGTKDKDLIRILVTRSEIDLGSIRQEYKRMYKRELADDLKSELSGDYEDIVLALVGKN